MADKRCCDAWSANDGGKVSNFDNTMGTGVDVVRLKLPAGNYVLNAKVMLGDRSAAGGGDFICTLRHGQTGNIGIDTAGVRLFGGAPANPGSMAMVSLTGTVSLTSTDTIRLNCGGTSTDAFAQWGQLNAIEVGAIH